MKKIILILILMFTVTNCILLDIIDVLNPKQACLNRGGKWVDFGDKTICYE